jgi:hypothetical protein
MRPDMTMARSAWSVKIVASSTTAALLAPFRR